MTEETRLEPRWIERLDVFNHAVSKLKQVLELRKEHELNEFERDSLVKRFEFTYEMAWKLLMSYEKSNGVTDIHGSKDVVRYASALSLIENGEAWMDMIDTRNLTSHIYDEEKVIDLVEEIILSHYPLLEELNKKMNELAKQR